MTRSASPAGFTLIELVVTVAIIGLLAAMAVPTFQIVEQRARENDLKLALREIRKAIDAYKQAGDEGRVEKKADQTGYPPTLDVLVDGVVDQRDPNQAKIYFLRRIPRDPFNPDPTVPAQSTWKLRSYASEPDAPEQGDDIFDVYDGSGGVGLNGIPYAKW